MKILVMNKIHNNLIKNGQNYKSNLNKILKKIQV
jgi:hypothetical protein